MAAELPIDFDYLSDLPEQLMLELRFRSTRIFPLKPLEQKIKYNINKFSKFLCRDLQNVQSFDRLKQISPEDKIIVYRYMQDYQNIPENVQDLIVLFHSFVMMEHGDFLENHLSKIIKHNMNIERKELQRKFTAETMIQQRCKMIKTYIRIGNKCKYEYLNQQKMDNRIRKLKRNRNYKYHRW